MALVVPQHKTDTKLAVLSAATLKNGTGSYGFKCQGNETIAVFPEGASQATV